MREGKAKDFIMSQTPVRCLIMGPWEHDQSWHDYWSNEDGWVSKEQATVFDLRELDNLPNGTVGLEIINAEGGTIAAGAPFLDYWKRRYIPGYAARHESAKDFIKNLGKHGGPGDSEYRMRKFVSGQHVRSVIGVRQPDGWWLAVTLDGGNAVHFGPFTEKDVRWYRDHWYSFADTRWLGLHEATAPGKAKDFIKKHKPRYGEVPTAPPTRGRLGRPVPVRQPEPVPHQYRESEEQMNLFNVPANFPPGSARKFINLIHKDQHNYRTGEHIQRGARMRSLVGKYPAKAVYIWEMPNSEADARRLGMPWREARIVIVLLISQGYGNPDKEWPIFQDWASFSVLKGALRSWRNLQGAQLFINGIPAGKISYRNPHLQ
jgi:hypothetical protein